MKRYEASYANRVLIALQALAVDGHVERSVRQLADAAGLSASAVQIGLTALRRTDRVRVARKGTAGKPSLLQVVSSEPLGDSGVAPAMGDMGSPLATAILERYEALLIDLNRERVAAEQAVELRRRVDELEAENAELRETVARLAALVGSQKV